MVYPAASLSLPPVYLSVCLSLCPLAAPKTSVCVGQLYLRQILPKRKKKKEKRKRRKKEKSKGKAKSGAKSFCDHFSSAATEAVDDRVAGSQGCSVAAARVVMATRS